MESREKKNSEPTEDDGDPNLDDDDEEEEEDDPSLDSLGRPVSGSRRTHGANIGLVHDNICGGHIQSCTWNGVISCYTP